MTWMWRIRRAVGAHTSDCIDRAVQDKAELYRHIHGMSRFSALGRASSEINAEVKDLFREGGVNAVRNRFKCIPRENLDYA